MRTEYEANEAMDAYVQGRATVAHNVTLGLYYRDPKAFHADAQHARVRIGIARPRQPFPFMVSKPQRMPLLSRFGHWLGLH